jgi:hypothetical protein
MIFAVKIFFLEIYGKLVEKIAFKIYLAYIFYQFSQYIKIKSNYYHHIYSNRITCFLANIKNIVFDVSIRSIPFSMKNDLKILCLKTVFYFFFFFLYFI